MTDADLAKTTLMAESRAWRQVALILCESVRRRLLYQNSPDREQFFAELKQAFDEKLARAGSLTFPGRPAAESQMMADLGRRPYALESMLRVHLMQNWFALSDPAMEEALYEIASLRTFARLSLNEPIPDETTILNFRHLLEANDLAEDMLKAINALLSRKGLLLKRGSIVDATVIAAPSSTKNAEGERDPEMHQTKKGNQWFFGMKAHIGVDADSGLVHIVTTTAANEADVEQVADLLHGKEEQVWADSGYRGAPARVDREDLQWHIAARPSDIAKLPEGRAKTKVQKAGHRKASMRAKVEHPFRVIKRQFGLLKVKYRGLTKNTAHVVTLFALSNLWMVRKQLMAMTGVGRLKTA